jgi:hypothetical protein
MAGWLPYAYRPWWSIGAEHRGQVEGLQEGARPVVDRLAGDRHVVGVHDAVHEADQHPPRDQLGLHRDDRLEQGQVRPFRLRRSRVVPGDRVVGEAAQEVDVAVARAYWKLPTRRWLLATRASTAPGQHRLARTGRPVATTASDRVVGMPEGVHRLADDVLAQHRADCGEPVAAARERACDPDPLRWRSRSRPAASRSSPSSRPRPSPRRLKPPNWWTGVGCATGAAPAAPRLPRACAGRRLRSQSGRDRARRQRLLSTSSRGSGARSASQSRHLRQLAREDVVQHGRCRATVTLPGYVPSPLAARLPVAARLLRRNDRAQLVDPPALVAQVTVPGWSSSAASSSSSSRLASGRSSQLRSAVDAQHQCPQAQDGGRRVVRSQRAACLRHLLRRRLRPGRSSSKPSAP